MTAAYQILKRIEQAGPELQERPRERKSDGQND